MRLGRILIIVAIIVILVLVAAYVFLNMQGGDGEQGPINTTDVVLLLQPVERGQTITAEMLGFLAYPT